METDESAQEEDHNSVHIADDTNFNDGVGTQLTTNIETTLTTTTVDYRAGLGFTSEDVADGFLKWFTGCAGVRSKQLAEDTETYGFSDIEKCERGMFYKLKRRLSQRSSRRSKHSSGKYERSRSHDDKNRAVQSRRQSSYEMAMNEPQGNAIMTLNNSSTISSETHRAPGNANIRISNDLGGHNDSQKVYNKGAHQSQKRYIKKDAPIVDPDVYQFTFPERGYMVNIVNDRFLRQPRRDGAQWDLSNMKEIGRKFGFRLFNDGNDRNLTRDQTLSLLTEIQLADHSNCDCFMFMISTHGLEQPNRALRGKLDHALTCADDKLIFTSSILDMFSDRNCPTLRGKPKIFFVQACRGEQLDHGSDVFVVDTPSVDRTDRTVVSDQKLKRGNKQESLDKYDTCPGQDSWTQHHGEEDVRYRPTATGNTNNKYTTTVTATLAAGAPQSYSGQPQFYVPKQSQIPTATSIRNQYTVTKVPFNPGTRSDEWLRPYPIVDTPSLRCSNDMLVMYAIPQGMYAWRSQTDGSWMIDYLHQELMSHNMTSPKNFLSLLTKVSFVMSQRSTNTPSIPEMDKKKAIPVIEHKLDKDIVFQQKVKGSEWVKKFKQLSL